MNIPKLPEWDICIRCPGCKEFIFVLQIHIPTTLKRRRELEVTGICKTCPDGRGRPGKYVHLLFKAEVRSEAMQIVARSRALARAGRRHSIPG